MTDIKITRNTASSFKFALLSSVTFAKAKLWIKVQNDDDIELDVYNVATNSSATNIISIDSNAGEITVDLNRLPFDSIYYKNFYFQFLDENNTETETTKIFQISPSGKKALYGIVNKLIFDFTQMATFSGTTVRIFKKSLVNSKCEKCWDFELDQPISSTCTCGGNRYTFIDILARKSKTESNQIYDNTGTKILEQAVFQTYSRVDFVKGTFFADLTDKNIYEVDNRKIANIGGVRTSTMFTGTLIKSNDVRVKELLNLLD